MALMDPQEDTSKGTHTINLDLPVNEQDMNTGPLAEAMDHREVLALLEVQEADSIEEARQAATEGPVVTAEATALGASTSLREVLEQQEDINKKACKKKRQEPLSPMKRNIQNMRNTKNTKNPTGQKNTMAYSKKKKSNPMSTEDMESTLKKDMETTDIKRRSVM